MKRQFALPGHDSASSHPINPLNSIQDVRVCRNDSVLRQDEVRVMNDGLINRQKAMSTRFGSASSRLHEKSTLKASEAPFLSKNDQRSTLDHQSGPSPGHKARTNATQITSTSNYQAKAHVFLDGKSSTSISSSTNPKNSSNLQSSQHTSIKPVSTDSQPVLDLVPSPPGPDLPPSVQPAHGLGIGYLSFTPKFDLGTSSTAYPRASLEAAEFYRTKSRAQKPLNNNTPAACPPRLFRWSDIRIQTPDFLSGNRSVHRARYAHIECDIFKPLKPKEDNRLAQTKTHKSPYTKHSRELKHARRTRDAARNTNMAGDEQSPRTRGEVHRRGKDWKSARVDVHKALPSTPLPSQRSQGEIEGGGGGGDAIVKWVDPWDNGDDSMWCGMRDKGARLEFPSSLAEPRMDRFKRKLRIGGRVFMEMARKERAFWDLRNLGE